MYTHYSVGVCAYRHDGFDLGSITVVTRDTEEAATKVAEYLMTLSDREILDDYVEGEFGTDADSWVESVFVDRWFTGWDCIQDGDVDDGTIVFNLKPYGCTPQCRENPLVYVVERQGEEQEPDERFRPIVWRRERKKGR
jgi:hypothetical protein